MRVRTLYIVIAGVATLLVIAGFLLFRFAPQSFGWMFGNQGQERLQSFFSFKAKDQNLAPLLGVGDPPPPRESFLTGLPVANPEKERFLAVMIDEAPQARPHFRGLDQAGVIFEMPAEGGIPRIMAIFSDNNPIEEIGPVRSARDYFVDLAEPIAGGYVHAGGSPQALSKLRVSAMRNIDENSDDPRFRRDPKIARPHNLFVKPTEAFKDISNAPLKASLFPYSEKLPVIAETVSATRIDVDFSTRRHAVAWEYDKANDCYKRLQEVEEMTFCPMNVIVMVTGVWLLEGDEKGRLGIRTTGTGKATVFRGGKAFPATWTRAAGGKIAFTDVSGVSILLKPGQTFVQIIDNPQKYAFTGALSPLPHATAGL